MLDKTYLVSFGTGAFMRWTDRHARTRTTHSLADMIRARVFAICCGYEDADDLNFLRSDPVSSSCRRLPDTGSDLVRSRPCRGSRMRHI